MVEFFFEARKVLQQIFFRWWLCTFFSSLFGVFPLFLPLAATAFGGPEGYVSLAIKAFGAIDFMLPKYYDRLGNMGERSLDSLI